MIGQRVTRTHTRSLSPKFSAPKFSFCVVVCGWCVVGLVTRGSSIFTPTNAQPFNAEVVKREKGKYRGQPPPHLRLSRLPEKRVLQDKISSISSDLLSSLFAVNSSTLFRYRFDCNFESL